VNDIVRMNNTVKQKGLLSERKRAAFESRRLSDDLLQRDPRLRGRSASYAGSIDDSAKSLCFCTGSKRPRKNIGAGNNVSGNDLEAAVK
jgi:hypothetical protein